MNMHSFRWIRLTAFSALAAAAITSCASAATDFNQVGKQMSLLLQNFHFSRKDPAMNYPLNSWKPTCAR